MNDKIKALLIVDVQNDFLPGGALAIPEGDQIIPVINAIQKHFDLVLATKDWHPEDHSSFAIRHGKKPGEMIWWHGRRQELWPVHCVQGTPGADFSPALDTHKISQVFFKGLDRDIDSYSSFFDNGHLRSTGLGDYLNAQGVREVYVAGLATDYCVKYSVLDAATLGFKPYVVLDACRGINIHAGDIEQALSTMRAAGAEIITSDAILER